MTNYLSRGNITPRCTYTRDHERCFILLSRKITPPFTLPRLPPQKKSTIAADVAETPLRVPTLAAPWRRSGLLSSAAVDSPLPTSSRLFSTDADKAPVKKRVEDVMPIAAGLEREELEGWNRVHAGVPDGEFGTQEAPAVIKSYFDRKIISCRGGEEDEHDIVWFWLKKDEPHECPLCSQYFVLEVIGAGGPPYGLDDDDDHHQDVLFFWKQAC